MVEAIILLLVLMVLTLFVYYFNDGDILSPAFLACFAFVVSCIAAIYDCYAWDTGISLTTIFVILFGLVCFVVPASFFGSRNCDREARVKTGKAITVPKACTAVVLVFGVVASIMYVRSILSVANVVNGDWSATMQDYRQQVSYGDSDEIALPSYVNYSFKLLMAFAYAYIFVFVNNLVVEKKVRLQYLLVPILYCGTSLTQASRGQIIIFLFAGIVMYWILCSRYGNRRLRVPFSAVVWIVIALIAGLALFTMAGMLVGRTTVKTPLDSLACYVGGSIIGLDMFLSDPGSATSPTNIFGAETFRGIYAFLSGTFGVPEWSYSFQMEYRFINGVNIGNLYTAFRYYIHDFGYVGMALLSIAQGIYYGVFYRILVGKKDFKSEISLGALSIIYSYLAIAVVYLPLADYLFHQYLNPTTILTLAMCAFAVLVLCKAGDLKRTSRSLHAFRPAGTSFR